MAENNRKYTFVLLVLALFGAVIFYGCGGSSSSDPIPDIEYSITGSFDSRGLSPNITASVRSSQYGDSLTLNGIYIYSENDLGADGRPLHYAEGSFSNRTFNLSNLKQGKHTIVFKHTPSNSSDPKNENSYIVRTSTPVVLTDSEPIKELKEKIVAVECDGPSISGKLTDISGKAISPTPTLTLWGQPIEVKGITGEFTTPKMPEGTVADLIVNGINYRQTVTPIEYNINHPAFYEISAVETSMANVPPTVILSLANNTSNYNPQDIIALTARAQDENNDELEFEWQIGSITSDLYNERTVEKIGEKEESQVSKTGNQYSSECYWHSPNEDCIATISVKVYEKTTYRLSAKASVVITLGTGIYDPDSKPQYLGVSIFPEDLTGNREYIITSNAIKAVSQELIITNDSKKDLGTLNKISSNTWKWKTPSLDEDVNFTLTFTAIDKKGQRVEPYTVNYKVQKTLENNESPEIVQSTPADSSQDTPFEVTSGQELKLCVIATDKENEKLEFKWSNKKGTLKDVNTVGNYNTATWEASATWVAPYIKTATETTIVCKINDKSKNITEKTFYLKIIPDETKIPPEIYITISGSNVYYKPTGNESEGIPLFKNGDVVHFSGKAIDGNQHEEIKDPSSFRWYLITPDGQSKLIGSKTAAATYSVYINTDSDMGDYTVRFEAVGLDPKFNITGEGTAEFRVNTPPVCQILCEGEPIGIDGRKKHTDDDVTYKSEGIVYDVYNVGDYLELVASFSDIETSQSDLNVNARWYDSNGISQQQKKYSSELYNAGALNTVSFSTYDSIGVYSATSTYSFYVNKAPEFVTATTTANSFTDSEPIVMNVTVTDDTPGLSVLCEIATATSDGNFSEYTPTKPDSGANPSTTFESELPLRIGLGTGGSLRNKYGGTSFKIRLTATDSMKLSSVNEEIAFSIQEPHIIKEFEIASGSYSGNTTFDGLTPFGIASTTESGEKYYYISANQKFSMRSGSVDDKGNPKWQDNMDWVWTDIYWKNGKPAETRNLDSYKDGYILNGYFVNYSNDEFGTHTIRLTGTSREYGISASNSIAIFINSAPEIDFSIMTDNGKKPIRFDTNSNARFTITLHEDNKYELLGLKWTIYELNENCELKNPDDPIEYTSHDFNRTDKSVIDMAGMNQKNVDVTWGEIVGIDSETGDPVKPLSKGAKRVFVEAFDKYGAKATASVDIMVNTLPKFNIVVPGTERKIKIEVSDDHSDYLKDQYATAPNDIPVYLITGESSMKLKFTVNVTDAPDVEEELDGDSITWNLSKEKGSIGGATSDNGKSIEARFSIGLNSINVEAHDEFYNHYYNATEGKYLYNEMCMASYSAEFYVWQSFAMDLEQKNHNYKAKALYTEGTNGVFYVTYEPVGENIATFVERFEIDLGTNMYCERAPDDYIYSAVKLANPNDANDIATHSAGVITLIQNSDSKVMILTDSSKTGLPIANPVNDRNTVPYTDPVSDKDKPLNYVASYSIVNIQEGGEKYSYYSSFASDKYPLDDAKFPEKILSMTWTGNSDTSAGIMLLKGLSEVSYANGAIAAYHNQKLKVIPETTSKPLNELDGSPLDLSDNSKIRYLGNLSNIGQNVFLTDTNNDRIIRLYSDFGQPNSIEAYKPIDICSTSDKYLFSLSESSDPSDAEIGAINLYSITATNTAIVTNFGEFTNSNNVYERAGKVKNPKSIIYCIKSGSGNDSAVFGGLVILEEGSDSNKSRIQVIRSNKKNWLE